MYLLNTIFLIIGILISILGVAAFFFPGLARIINAPGGPRMQAIIALIVGVIFIIVSLAFEMPLPD